MHFIVTSPYSPLMWHICTDAPFRWLTGRKKKPWFVVAASFYGVNIPILVNFKLPTWCHYHWSAELGRRAHNWFSRVGLSQDRLALKHHWLPLAFLCISWLWWDVFQEHRSVILSSNWGSSDTSLCLHSVYELCGGNATKWCCVLLSASCQCRLAPLPPFFYHVVR